VRRNLLLNYSSILFVLCMAGCDGSSEVVPRGSLAGFVSQIEWADSYEFEPISTSKDESGIIRQVVSFDVDGLNQFALVLWPSGRAPASGWPC